jgi:Cu2+-containing amine oxidase
VSLWLYKSTLLSSPYVNKFAASAIGNTTAIMSTEQVPISLPFVGAKKVVVQHPIGPLTASEISESSKLIRSVWPSNTEIHFKVITLQEPKKTELVTFLAAEHAGHETPTVERRSFVVYYIRNTVRTSSEDKFARISDKYGRTNSTKPLSI